MIRDRASRAAPIITRTTRHGYRYKGRAIGHSFDGDSSVFTLGGMLTGDAGSRWLVTAAIGNLNRRNAGPTSVAANKTRYREIEVVHKRGLWIGELSLGLGYDYRKDTVTRVKDRQRKGVRRIRRHVLIVTIHQSTDGCDD